MRWNCSSTGSVESQELDQIVGAAITRDHFTVRGDDRHQLVAVQDVDAAGPHRVAPQVAREHRATGVVAVGALRIVVEQAPFEPQGLAGRVRVIPGVQGEGIPVHVLQVPVGIQVDYTGVSDGEEDQQEAGEESDREGRQKDVEGVLEKARHAEKAARRR